MLPDNPKSSSPTPTISINNDHGLEYSLDSKTGVEKLLEENDGYIVGRMGDRLLQYRTDAHFLTISPTGGGKTTGVLIPNLLEHTGAAFVIDIRGETVAKTANVKRLQGHPVIILDPYGITGLLGTDQYNPLDRLKVNEDDRSLNDRIDRFVNALMFDPQGRQSKEPIWDNATKALLAGILTYLIKYKKETKPNLGEVLDILNFTKDQLISFERDIIHLLDTNDIARQDRQLKSLLKILGDGKSETKITDNALIQAQTLLRWVGNEAFDKHVSMSTFSFSQIRDTKAVVYVVIPEEFIESCASWTRIIIESAIFSQGDTYDKLGKHTSELNQEDRVLMLLDELPAFGQMDVISKNMATVRGRGISLWLFIQNIAQLYDVYGEQKARTILANAAALQVFNSTELEELEYLSKLVGEEFYDVQTVGISETRSTSESNTEGTSHTISNSESTSTSKSTSDSITEASGLSWNSSKSKSRNWSKNKNRNYGDSRGGGDGTSSNENSSNGYSDGANGMSQSKNKGVGEGKSSNTSWNKQRGHGHGTSKGGGVQNTVGEGSSETTSNTHGTTISNSHTKQSGESHGKSQSHTTGNSESKGINISVKQERLKIETIRTLRDKLSDRNQLLYIRGHHPFFTPRMSYFVKFLDADMFMFPEMAALISGDVVEHFNVLLRQSTNFESISKVEDSALSVQELLDHWEGIKAKDFSGVTGHDEIEAFQKRVGHAFKSIKQAKEELKDIMSHESLKYLKKIHDTAVDQLALVGQLQVAEETNRVGENAVQVMQSGTDASIERMNQFESLPIMSFNATGRDMIDLDIRDVYWWLNVNLPVLRQINALVQEETARVQGASEDVVYWKRCLFETFPLVESKLPEALETAILRENELRSEFLAANN